MRRSGFVLAGGLSTRMGKDKALLLYQGKTMLEHVAAVVREVVGNVAVIGAPELYGALVQPIYADKIPGCGPIGGIYTALSVSATDWNLVFACDMPAVSAAALQALVQPEAGPGTDCVLAIGPGGPEPLCAVYHRRCLAALDRAIRDKRFKMRDLVPELKAEFRAVEPAALANLNTRAEWAEFEQRTR